jgi:hypothetical protein
MWSSLFPQGGKKGLAISQPFLVEFMLGAAIEVLLILQLFRKTKSLPKKAEMGSANVTLSPITGSPT